MERLLVHGPEGVDYAQLKVGDYVNYPVQYDNVGTWVDSSSGEIKGNIPEDRYNGWRILSVDVEKEEVRLISAGVPLNYYHGNESAKSVKNLTTKFFETPIQSNITQYAFYKCGFKGKDGTSISDINVLKEVFNNEYTAIDGATQAPKVQAMTKEDLDAVWGSTTSSGTYVNSNDLLAVPCKAPEASEYAMTWLASAFDDSYLWLVSFDGYVGYSNYYAGGVRSAVSLKSKIKFVPAEENKNETQTWDVFK